MGCFMMRQHYALTLQNNRIIVDEVKVQVLSINRKKHR